MSYALEMCEKAKHCSMLSEMDTAVEHSYSPMPFPLSKPYICFGTEYVSEDFLIGDDSICIKENMLVRIDVSDESNGEYCRECARIVCTALTELDSQKRIVSISADKCCHDQKLGTYFINIKFGLREVRRSNNY